MTPSRSSRLLLTALLALLVPACGGGGGGAPLPPADSTRRASLSSQQAEGDNVSSNAFVTADGRYVAFNSNAGNLVAGDANAVTDVFVRDTVLGTTIRASLGDDESEGAFGSTCAGISADGRYVCFRSVSGNLVGGDTNGVHDVFVRDLVAGTTIRVSVADDETEANDLSTQASLSSGGRYVAFTSPATNLAAGDTNGRVDVFLRDTLLNTTVRVSVADNEAESDADSADPTVSADGRLVAFETPATNLVAGDANASTDVFVRDLLAGTTTRVSVADDESEGNGLSHRGRISADGRFVAFGSAASNLPAGGGDLNGTSDVFVRDLLAGTTQRVSLSDTGNEIATDSTHPTISADGRYIAYRSGDSTQVPGDSNGFDDIFRRDSVAKTTMRISVADGGAQPNQSSSIPRISADGRFVVYESSATNLVPGDANGDSDVFIRGPLP